jgi:hypothetical protein
MALPRWGLLCSLLFCAGGACSSSGSDADPAGGGSGGSGASAGRAGGAGRAGSAGTGGSGGRSGTGGATGTGGTTGNGGSANDAGDTCNPEATPGTGVFVSPSGSDTAGDGTIEAPLATIARGLDVAADTDQSTIYLDQGTYPEPVRFSARHAGIFIEGGWSNRAAAWTRDCSPEARRNTIIRSPTAVGVQVDELAERSGLRSLSVATKTAGTSAPNKAGESLYGIHVTGANTLFSLEDVAIETGRAGSGGAATAVVPGPKATCTDLLTQCGDASTGVSGANGDDAPAGSFDANGYVAGDGQPGTPGGAGKNGGVGAPGQSAACYLEEGCRCDTASTNCAASGTSGTKMAGRGACGCGGDGGNAGSAGRGGGASIGVYASGSGVIVSVTSSAITAGDGGAGSQGGAGLPGSDGRPGTKGADVRCPVECVKGGSSCQYDGCTQAVANLTGGNAGSAGGNGASGGRGGGGAGGPSHALVHVEGASIIVSRSSLGFGAPGAGAGSAPSGSAGERLPP